MNKEPKKPDGEPNEMPDKIYWSEQGAPLSLENIPVWPKVKLPDETLKAIAQTQELSSAMTTAVESIQLGCKYMQDSMAATSEIINTASIAFANLPITPRYSVTYIRPCSVSPTMQGDYAGDKLRCNCWCFTPDCPKGEENRTSQQI